MFVDPSAITLPLAVLAGVVSFISPCVLPLVPAYIGYLTGQAANTARNNLAVATASPEGSSSAASVSTPNQLVVFLHGVFFVLGFSFVFVLLGVGAGVLGNLGRAFTRILNPTIASGPIFGLTFILTPLGVIGGLLIIVLGLHTMGVIRIPFLYYDTRKQEAPRNDLGFLGSFIMGITFSAGWSPCIGPILAAMLTMGTATGSAGQAALLLGAYALGLGIPFLLAAALVDRVTPHLRRLQKQMRVIEIISGVLLIVVGLLIFSGMLQRLLAPLAGNTDYIIAIDEWLVRIAGGGQ